MNSHPSPRQARQHAAPASPTTTGDPRPDDGGDPHRGDSNRTPRQDQPPVNRPVPPRQSDAVRGDERQAPLDESLDDEDVDTRPSGDTSSGSPPRS